MKGRNSLPSNKRPHSPIIAELPLVEKQKYFEWLLRTQPHVEKHLHLACVTYLRDYYPEVIINHTRNQTTAHGNHLSVLYGYCKGYPDLFIARKTKEYGGYFIEFKTPRSKYQVTTEQEYVHRILTEQGYLVDVIWTYRDFIEKVTKYLNESFAN